MDCKKIQKENRVFAHGLCFTKIFFLFVIGSVLGVYYEQILTLIRYYIRTGTIRWELRRGVIYGPFNPLYGCGVALITVLLLRKNRPWYQTLLYSSLLGGIIEYSVSFLQEYVIGTSSWNYHGYFLEIGGRTTIPFMLVWGILGVLFTYIIYPKLSRLIEKIPYQLGHVLTWLLAIFLVFDMTVSWTALWRSYMRRMNRKPYTVIGQIYDEIYPDSYLKRYFPNMRPVKERK